MGSAVDYQNSTHRATQRVSKWRIDELWMWEGDVKLKYGMSEKE